MPDNLFAYTAHAGSYPEYASLNEGDDGKLQLTVRGPAEYPGASFHAHPGAQATIELPVEQIEALALGCLRWLAEHKLLQDDPPRVRPLSSSMAEGCCSAVSPCSHQRRDPTTICAQCNDARLKTQPLMFPDKAVVLTKPAVFK